MVWYLAIALLVTWFLLFMCTAKEPSFMNKVKKNAEDTRQCAMRIYFLKLRTRTIKILHVYHLHFKMNQSRMIE